MALVLSCRGAARAAEPPALDAARGADPAALAEALFVEGRRLMEQGRLEQACPKLDESQRVDPGGGARLNAALCRERQGKLATAWSQFKLALADARQDARPDRVAFAEHHLAALEPRLPRLRLRLGAGVDATGATILLDGLAVGPAALDVPVPLDPGRHEVTLRTTDGARVFVVDAREATTSELVLEPSAGGPRAEPRAARRRWGVLTASAGAAAVVAGGAFVLVARSRQADADAVCPGVACAPGQARAVDDNASAHRWARAADVALALGAVGLGVGSYLVVTSPLPPVAAGASRGAGVVSLSGRF